MSLSECFECLKELKEEELELHHVIPKSLGGKRVVPLCPECHDRAHDKKGSRKTSISLLTKKGMAEARSRGRALGRPDRVRYGFSISDGCLVPNEAEQSIISLAVSLRNEGLSYPAIASRINATGHRNRVGGLFCNTTIRRIFLQREKDRTTRTKGTKEKK